jgi:sugar O-acyltransferase (sialic acid O-acetyltransferase NeuD family)
MLDTLRKAGCWEVVGLLDDNDALHGASLAGAPVLGGSDLIESLKVRGVTHLAFAFGDNRAREALIRRAVAAGLAPANAIHPSAIVAEGVELGGGIWMAAGAIVNPGSRIGDGVVINTGATVDHDCVLETCCNISPGCHLSGRTRVGRYAFLGTAAATLPDVVIGEGATVGAGAVVIRDVRPGATVVGVPAGELER